MSKMNQDGNGKKPTKSGTKRACTKAKKPQLKGEKTPVFDCAAMGAAIDSSIAQFQLLVREAELTLLYFQKNGANGQEVQAVRVLREHFQAKERNMMGKRPLWQLYEKLGLPYLLQRSSSRETIPQLPENTRDGSSSDPMTLDELELLLSSLQNETSLYRYHGSALAGARWGKPGSVEILLELAGILTGKSPEQKVVVLEDYLKRKGRI
jgi:hypothetical protein